MPRETTYIPTKYPDSFFGGAGLIATLAYPNDIQRRYEFVDAVTAWGCKQAIKASLPRKKVAPKFRSLRNRKILSILDKAFHTYINKRRLMAAEAAAMLLTNDGPVFLAPDNFEDPDNLEGANRFVMEIQGVPAEIRKLLIREDTSDQRTESQERNTSLKRNTITKLCESIAIKLAHTHSPHEDSKPISESLEEQANAVAHRIWGESLPVLHIAMAFRTEVMVLLDELGHADPFHFLSKPDHWLQRTLASAESYRTRLIEHQEINVKEEDTIRLLPAPG